MDEKVKAFVAHIMDECEQEGFTLAEVTAITVQFDATVSSRICESKRKQSLPPVKSCENFRVDALVHGHNLI